MEYPQSFKAFMELVDAQDHPPAYYSKELSSLWWDAKGDWDKAHDCIEALDSVTASRIHAYLHRKEGDSWNAGYWYKRANRSIPSLTLDEEFISIVNELLKP